MSTELSISDTFRGTRGPTHADIMIVGEAYGEEEQRQRQPFVGASGKELSRIISQLSLDESQILFSNVVNARPQANDMRTFFWPTQEAKKRQEPQLRGLFPREIVWDGLRRLHKQIEYCQPKLIIGFGNYSLWALTHDSFKISNSKKTKVPTGIGNWHGSQIYTTHGIPFLPTYHPAAAMRNWAWMYQIRHDLSCRFKKLITVTNDDIERWDWDKPEFNFIVRPSFDEVVKKLTWFLQQLDRGPFKLAHDLETRANHIACGAWAWSPTDALCIPFMTQDNDEGYWSVHEEQIIAQLERQILQHPNLILSGQNYIYDVQYIAKYRQCIPVISRDTMIGHHCAYPGTPASLVHIRCMYCHYHRYWKDDGKTWEVGVDEEQLWTYNCEDAVTTYEASDVIFEEVIPYHQLEQQVQEGMDQIQQIVRMMLRGVRIDFAEQERIARDLRRVTLQIEQELELMVPQEIWPRKAKASPWYSSPTQTASILYDVLLLKKQFKDGSLTTEDSALEKLADLYPLVERLLRTLQKFRTLSAFWQFATMTTDTDGRARSVFSPTAETFRWRSGESAFGSGRNLQNLPKGQEE